MKPLALKRVLPLAIAASLDENDIRHNPIFDAPASHLMASRSFDLLKKLQSWGVYFPVDESGNFRTLKYHLKRRFQTAMEEPTLKDMIAQRAQDAGALVVNPVMGFDLLLDDGRVSGATLSAWAAMVCKESRWGDAHRRTDDPERDDRNWLCQVVVRSGDGSNGIRVETRPVIGLDGREVRS